MLIIHILLTKIFDLQSTEKSAVKHLTSAVRDKPGFPEGFTMEGWEETVDMRNRLHRLVLETPY
jgi:hypothetical protein